MKVKTNPIKQIKKLLLIPEFKIGDIVQGKDKSFVRSYYEVVGMTPTMLILLHRRYEDKVTAHKSGYNLYLRPKVAFAVQTNHGIIDSLANDFVSIQLDKKDYKVGDRVHGIAKTSSGKKARVISEIGVE